MTRAILKVLGLQLRIAPAKIHIVICELLYGYINPLLNYLNIDMIVSGRYLYAHFCSLFFDNIRDKRK